ncbi:MAG: carbohydrate ABC transporter permease [Armatimonadetes bacterium]|nr:ABC transporter permease subunit [Armatimonadota bacterium]MBS1700328.1 carbohydrate ABC transporter permease [Armatimonadota bacterium]MBS1727769.1 carbohydrate ABC transporter permease [Armatimonadota bacterium]
MKLWRLATSAVMTAVAIIFLSPIVLMILTSFKREADVLNPSSPIPKIWTLENYRNVLGWAEEAPFGRWLMNSIFVSCCVTLLVLLFSSMAAYAITRLKVPGGRTFLTVVVFSMMIPGQLFLVPVYYILSKLHWLDTPLALIVPATAGGFGVFMLCQFMRAVPTAIEEAALIDGCSPAGVYSRVTLPLVAPALATLGVFTFIGSWNDYVGPLVFMDSVRNYTLPVGIAMYQSSYLTEYGKTLAIGTMASLPLMLIFLIFQKQIVDSMSATGLKD